MNNTQFFTAFVREKDSQIFKKVGIRATDQTSAWMLLQEQFEEIVPKGGWPLKPETRPSDKPEKINWIGWVRPKGTNEPYERKGVLSTSAKDAGQQLKSDGYDVLRVEKHRNL